jgi:hypothetical protein
MKKRAEVNRGESGKESTTKCPTAPSAADPMLTQIRGDDLLKKLFFSRRVLPIVIEPEPSEPKEVIKRQGRRR